MIEKTDTGKQIFCGMMKSVKHNRKSYLLEELDTKSFCVARRK